MHFLCKENRHTNQKKKKHTFLKRWTISFIFTLLKVEKMHILKEKIHLLTYIESIHISNRRICSVTQLKYVLHIIPFKCEF